MTKEDLKILIIDALKSYNGSASIVNVAKYIWNNNRNELVDSGNLLYTWQYDMRWAAQSLRNEGLLKPTAKQISKKWELT